MSDPGFLLRLTREIRFKIPIFPGEVMVLFFINRLAEFYLSCSLSSCSKACLLVRPLPGIISQVSEASIDRVDKVSWMFLVQERNPARSTTPIAGLVR